MDIYRLHTDSDGESIIETIAMPMSAEDEQGHMAATFPSAEVVFCESGNGFTQDWHNAPRRQLVIVLEGVMEIELKNGDITRLTPGQILLSEDLTGSGHLTRTSKDSPLKTAIIPLT